MENLISKTWKKSEAELTSESEADRLALLEANATIKLLEYKTDAAEKKKQFEETVLNSRTGDAKSAVKALFETEQAAAISAKVYEVAQATFDKLFKTQIDK